MSIELLDFTKDWSVMDSASEKYFPTIEHNERQVREDIQLLHDEAKAKINELITMLGSGTAGSDIGVTPVSGGTAATVQGALEELKSFIDVNTAAKHTHSNMALLNSYTQTEQSLADAVDKKHSHTNKSALDNITGQKYNDWNRVAEVFSFITGVATDLEDEAENEVPTVKAVVDALGSVGSGVFMAEYGATTYDEVEEALKDGKPVYVLELEMDGDRVYNARLYTFSDNAGHVFRFTCIYVSGLPLFDTTMNVYDCWLQDDDSWVKHTTPVATKKYVDDKISIAIPAPPSTPNNNYYLVCEVDSGGTPTIRWQAYL